MAENLPPAAPSGEPASFKYILGFTVSFVAVAASEWLPSLVNQPIKPPFEYDAPFDNESSRLARLLSVVILILLFLFGGLRLFDVKVAVQSVIATALITLIIAFIAAIFHNLFAHAFRVRMFPPVLLNDGTIKKFASQWQILFAVLYTFVPWLPVFTFLVIAIFNERVVGTAYTLSVLSFLLSAAYALYNYVKAMREITNCPAYRIWFSSLAPLVLLLLFILFR